MSDLGRVRRHPSHLYNNSPGILRASPIRHGYLRVSFSHDGRRRDTTVAPLVLTVFRGPRPSEQHVAGHRNGIKTDNRLANLGWITYKENEADKVRHGTKIEGSRHKLAKLTEDNVRLIKRLLKAGHKHKDLAVQFGVSYGKIGHISTGLSWKHVKD